MSDRYKALGTWAAIIGPILPVVLGLIAFFWGQASAANERISRLEREGAAWEEVLKSIDRRLQRIENRLDGK